MALSFREMKEEDLDSVCSIERESFSDPWKKEYFEQELLHDSFVSMQDSELAGYICTWIVLDECTVTNIAVKPAYRRQGIGEYMLNNLFRIMDKHDIRYYYLEVRASNQAALALYDKLGFNKVGLRRDYYHNPIEDAIVMSLDKQKDYIRK